MNEEEKTKHTQAKKKKKTIKKKKKKKNAENHPSRSFLEDKDRQANENREGGIKKKKKHICVNNTHSPHKKQKRKKACGACLRCTSIHKKKSNADGRETKKKK